MKLDIYGIAGDEMKTNTKTQRTQRNKREEIKNLCVPSVLRVFVFRFFIVLPKNRGVGK